MSKFNWTSTLLLLLTTGPAILITALFSKSVVYKKPDIWLNSYLSMDSYRGIFPDGRFRFQDHFQNDLISKNGSDYVVSADIRAVAFSCEAEYAITWAFPFPEQLENLHPVDIYSRDYRSSEFDQDSLEPVNLRFKSIISIACSELEFLSANLTCSSVEIKPQLESSVYIYLTGKSSLENEGETIHMSLEPNMLSSSPTNVDTSELSPLELPCRPASPNLKLLLEKQDPAASNDSGTVWNPVPLFSDGGLSFDPKVGFTLQRGLLSDSIFGVYRCSVIDDDNDGQHEQVITNQFVTINVTMETTKLLLADDKHNNPQEHEDASTEMAFEPRSNIHGNASVRLEVHFENDFPTPKITCCSGVQDKPPHLYFQYCNNPLQCQRVKETFLEDASNEISADKHLQNRQLSNTGNISSDCSVNVLFATSLFVMCRGENVDFVEQFVHLFHPLAGSPVTNRSDKILLGASGSKDTPPVNVTHHPIVSLSQFESSDVVKAAIVTQKVILVIGVPRDIGSLQQNKNIGPGIYFRAHHSDVNNDLLYGQDELGIFEDDLITVKRKRYISLVEYNRDEYYEGELIVPMCFGLKFYYARGPHLRLNWINGTRTILEKGPINRNRIPVKEKAHALFLSGNADMFEGDAQNLISIFGTKVIAKQGMSSVDCWMPLRNGSEWDMISKSLKVLPSVAPRFLEEEEQVVYFYLGQVGNAVTCTLVEGRPFPSVVVTRDGRRQKLIINESKNETKKRLEEREGKNATRDTESKDEKKHLLAITISFTGIVHTHQGEIRCVAKNVNGTATRVIKIFVLEKTGKALPVSLSIVGILCLLLIGLGVKHWRKRNVQPQSLPANNT